MRYRIATQADISALAELRWAFCTEEEEVSPKIDPQEFLAVCTQFLSTGLTSNQWVYWVAEADNEIVAHIFIQRVKKVPKPQRLDDCYGYLTNVYTKPSYRGRGIGSKLMERVKDWAETEDLDTLIVWPSEASVNFYRRSGFKRQNAIMEYDLRLE